MNTDRMNRGHKISSPRWRYCRRCDDGYALPSVLLLVTILSLVVAAVIVLANFDRRLAALAVSRAKAGYAAESGVAALLADIHTMSDLRDLISRSSSQFFFPDGSEAGVTVEPWGLFLVVRSEGLCNAFRFTRTALVADTPPSMFEHALLFGNDRHQLVFSGDAHVRGSVVVGRHGAGTGGLPGRSTPIRLPVDGPIRVEATPRVPEFRSSTLLDLIVGFGQHIGGRGMFDRRLHGSPGHAVPLHRMPDSVRSLFVDGDLHVGKLSLSRVIPVRLFVRGDVVIGPGADLRGLLSIAAAGSILIERGSNLEHVLLFSRRTIVVEPSVRAVAQLIASRIVVGEGASLLYPSILLSLPPESGGPEQAVIISREARVEGLVSLLAADVSVNAPVIMRERATVVGAVHVQGVMTFDGHVVGSVLTSDFFFHQEQADYYGWLRMGSIDRVNLPEGFLLPPGFALPLQLEVLDWL